MKHQNQRLFFSVSFKETQLLLKYAFPLVLLLFATACGTTSPQSGDTTMKSEFIDASFSSEQSIAIGDQLYRQSDYQTALVHYIAALEHQPDSADTLYRIAVANIRLDNTEVAMAAFKQVLVISPLHLGANEGLGLQYLKLRQYDAARTHLVRATTVDGQLTRAQNALGILDDLDRDHDSAKKHFTAGGDGPDAVTYNNVGYSGYLAGDWSAAEKGFQAALAHDPNFERALNNLGLLYVRKGEYSRAFDIFSRSMSAPEAYNNVGYFSMLTGMHDEAAHFLQRAIDESPRYYARAEQNLLRNSAQRAKHSTGRPQRITTAAFSGFNSSNVQTGEVVTTYAPLPQAHDTAPEPTRDIPPAPVVAVADFPKEALICRVGTHVLRVRKGADAEAESIAALFLDQEVAVLVERNEWVKISYLNKKSQKMRRGWINSNYLQGDEQSTRCGALGNGRFDISTDPGGEEDMQTAFNSMSE